MFRSGLNLEECHRLDKDTQQQTLWNTATSVANKLTVYITPQTKRFNNKQHYTQ